MMLKVLNLILEFFPDKLFLQLKYFKHFHHFINFKNPLLFSEKIQWLKIYNRNPELVKLVDKYLVKGYIAEKIGEEYVIPTIGVWNYAEEIDLSKLPNSFVLKWNHDSGSIIICKDKSSFDFDKAKNKLKKYEKHNGFLYGREWPYKYVNPKIIAEPYLEDESGELRDYKFFCFDGNVKFLQVDFGRFSDHHRNFYDLNWNILPFVIKYPSSKKIEIRRPNNLEKMIEIASLLSKNIPHVRVDLYNINGKIYFGELTFFHGSGFERISPIEWDANIGSFLKLPQKKK